MKHPWCIAGLAFCGIAVPLLAGAPPLGVAFGVAGIVCLFMGQ